MPNIAMACDPEHGDKVGQEHQRLTQPGLYPRIEFYGENAAEAPFRRFACCPLIKLASQTDAERRLEEKEARHL